VTVEELGEALDACLPPPPLARGKGIHEPETAIKALGGTEWREHWGTGRNSLIVAGGS